MEDRMKFEVTTLDNGITIYGRHTDDPFVYASIYVPVGHIHSTGTQLPGTAHFLEHMVGNRSAMFPELDSFGKFVQMNGGGRNAGTDVGVTDYWFKVHAGLFETAFRGLVSMVFEPLFEECDLANEVSVISNERKRKNKWYPMENEYAHYLSQSWKHYLPCSLRQRLGEDEDLRSMNVESLRQFHENYFDPRVFVVVGGSYDLDFISRELSRFGTQKHNLPEQFDLVGWQNREYHERAFNEVNRFEYRFGGIVDSVSVTDTAGLGFLGSFLTNNVHGVLYDWLRKELGWSYDVRFIIEKGDPWYKPNWEFVLPVNSYKQVEHVRALVHKKILRAISDHGLIQREFDRKLASTVFDFQTIGESVDRAETMLQSFGRIISETEGEELLRASADSKFLREIYEKYMSPDVIGEFLAVPSGA